MRIVATLADSFDGGTTTQPSHQRSWPRADLGHIRETSCAWGIFWPVRVDREQEKEGFGRSDPQCLYRMSQEARQGTSCTLQPCEQCSLGQGWMEANHFPLCSAMGIGPAVDASLRTLNVSTKYPFDSLKRIYGARLSSYASNSVRVIP